MRAVTPRLNLVSLAAQEGCAEVQCEEQQRRRSAINERSDKLHLDKRPQPPAAAATAGEVDTQAGGRAERDRYAQQVQHAAGAILCVTTPCWPQVGGARRTHGVIRPPPPAGMVCPLRSSRGRRPTRLSLQRTEPARNWEPRACRGAPAERYAWVGARRASSRRTAACSKLPGLQMARAQAGSGVRRTVSRHHRRRSPPPPKCSWDRLPSACIPASLSLLLSPAAGDR